ncbi:MAG: DnaB-like helicase N-terminal domain-containing protein [Sporichthyaceae bacterium]
MNALDLAERATLGSLLAADCGREVIRWLRPSDFADPWHGEVCRVIRELSTAGAQPDPEAVGLALLGRLGPTRAAVVRIAGLLRVAPAHAHPATYAVMVLDAALRREVASQAVLLRAGALSAVLDGSSRPMQAVRVTINATLDAAEGRWNAAAPGPNMAPAAPGQPMGLGESTSLGTRRLRSTDHGVGADRFLRAHPRLDPAEVADHEAVLVAALIARPAALGPVRGWLRPEAITNPDWRPVYAAVLREADHGRPIDPVTVAWEIQHRAATLGSGPEPKVLLARVEASLAASPGYLARVVAADHLRLAAEVAAEVVSESARNPELELWEVLGVARTQVATLTTAARPLAAGGAVTRTSAMTQRQTVMQRRDRPGPLAIEGREG